MSKLTGTADTASPENGASGSLSPHASDGRPGSDPVFPQFADAVRAREGLQTRVNVGLRAFAGPCSMRSSRRAARIRPVDLGRIAWTCTVLVCLVTVAILLVDGYYGYAEVTFAVAVSAGINLA